MIDLNNARFVKLGDSGDLDPGSNISAASAVLGDLPFTGFDPSRLVVLATLLCALG